MTTPEKRIIIHEMRGIPYSILQDYLVDLGGTFVDDNSVHGDGWKIRMERMEPFRLGSLSVGQSRLTMELDEAIADDFIVRFQKKTLRAGG